MIDNDIALANVRDILDILQQHNIQGWVQDGTLLGLVRDGHVMRWDHDADTGCFYCDWNDKAEKSLIAAGFECSAKLGTPENGWQHRWIRNRVKVDIFFYYTDADTRIWHAAYLGGKIQYRFYYQRFNLCSIETSTGTLMAPLPPERFLEIKYGEDWRVPKRRWHFANDPKNGVRIG